MVVAVRRQNALHHMPAGRILTAMMQPTELDIAAIVPMDIRGTHTCKGLMDAKILMNAPSKVGARMAASTWRENSAARAHQE